MVTVNTRFSVHGPLFQKSNVRKATQEIVQALVESGEQRLDTMLRPRPAGVYLSVAEAGKGKASGGYYRRNVHGRVSNLNGRIDDGGVVYGPWLEGVSRGNETTRFKGYASFRKTSQWLQKNLRKIAGPAIQRMVERLR